MSDTLIADAMAGRIDKATAFRQYTVQAAVQRKITCPDCSSILDQRRATVLETNGRSIGISCNACYQKTLQKVASKGLTPDGVRLMLHGLNAVKWDSETKCSDDVLQLIAQQTQAQQ